MLYVNKAIIGGRMVADPEVQQYGHEGKELVKIVVAANKPSFQGRNRKYISTFVEVTIFGKTGEFVKNYLVKGDEVLVDGELTTRTWKDKLGDTKSCLCVTAASVVYVSSKRKEETEESTGQNHAAVDPAYGPCAGADDMEDTPF